MKFGREPDLGVHDVVERQILDALVGNPVQRLRRLHDADRVGEGLQVALERSAVRGGAEELGEAVDVGRGQVVVAGLLGEVEDGRGSQPAVEVVVQQRLGRPPDGVHGQRCGHGMIRSMISGPMSGAVVADAPAAVHLRQCGGEPLRGLGVQSEQRLALRRPVHRACGGCATPAPGCTRSPGTARPAPSRHTVNPTAIASISPIVPPRGAVMVSVLAPMGNG